MKERKRHSSSAAPPSSSTADSAAKGVPKRPAKRQKGAASRGFSCLGQRWGYSIFTVFVVGLLAASVYYNGAGILWKMEDGQAKPRAITPLPAARVTDLKQFKGEHRERFFWGTYRPQLYLGIRSRTPESLLAGLMWIGVNDGQYALRHTCEQSDKLTRYGWLRHDGATYGRQELLDQGLLLSTSFLKSSEPGSGYGGDWVVRIKVEEDNTSQPKNDEEDQQKSRPASVFFYLAEEAGKALNIWPQGIDGEHVPLVAGNANEIGGWELHAKYKDDVEMNYVGLRQLHMHNLTQLVLSKLVMEARKTGRLQLADGLDKNSNIAVIQLTGAVPFEFDMVFVSGVDKKAAQLKTRVESLTGTQLEKRLLEKEQAFDNRFHETFKLQEKVDGEKELEVGMAALSNMIGGIGYFYGQSRVAIPHEFKDQEVDGKGPKYWLYWPAQLYTAVPSRSFFPRGFLWDEGFHQLVISRWDRNISLDVIGHWLDLMNIDGWIPREQILGAEARSKVPEEFITQHTTNANPPTLLLIIRRLALRFEADKKKGVAKEEDVEYFKTIFPRLEAWFKWFNTTQIGKEPGTYYWHGRDPSTNLELNPKTLTSGLDDYPRASHPTDDERHVDLWCWMAHAANTLALVARITGQPHERYEVTAKELMNLTRLNEMHYDVESGHYYDYGLHSEQVKLRWKEIQDPNTGYTHRNLRRAVVKRPKLGWVPHFGYVSFFPFAMRIIPPESPIFGHHLELLHSHHLLWTNCGLRSLATTSSIFMKHNTEHDAPYWRGPVWMNMNYLILSALYEYSQVEGPYKNTASIIYPQLRDNLIRNTVQRYHESGYLWENYLASGKGQGSHPFTGWTALILLIMGEMY